MRSLPQIYRIVKTAHQKTKKMSINTKYCVSWNSETFLKVTFILTLGSDACYIILNEKVRDLYVCIILGQERWVLMSTSF